VGSWALIPPQLTHEVLLTIRVPMVVSAQHPLATHAGRIPNATLAEYIQISHLDPCDMSVAIGAVRAKYPKVWRLSHFGAKLAFLRAGFGFGGMPLHTIQADLAKGVLVEITPEDAPAGGHLIEMRAVSRTDSPPGPAGRWFIDRLKQSPVKRELSRSQPVSVAAQMMRRRASSRLLASKRKQNR
jgi:DNA-binding transcriptional LysR family regulator